MGSMLVYDVLKFLAQTQDTSEHLRSELDSLAERSSGIWKTGCTYSEDTYYNMYWSNDEEAFLWEDYFRGEALIHAWQVLRPYVKATRHSTEI